MSSPPIESSRRRSSTRRPSISTEKLGRMVLSRAPKPGADFLGPRLKVIAIVDPMTATATAVLERKRNSFVISAYRDTRICSSFADFVATMKPEEMPHAIIVGSPPGFRGSMEKGRDIEVQILEAFPKNTPALFIEKPISTHTVEQATHVGRALTDSQTVVSVGYVLRYLKVVQKMRSVLEDNNLEVMATNARYVSTYSAVVNPAWWNKETYGGPIVEQATHFIDLSRYFGGDVLLETVQATSLEWYDEAGKLSEVNVDEGAIPEEKRIPRVTSAIWNYENGGVGSLVHLALPFRARKGADVHPSQTHSINLQGIKYATDIEVYADGYKLYLSDPYNAPVLRIRSPASDNEEVCTFEDDDPYFSEVQAFIDASDPSNTSAFSEDVEILSSFDDSLKTYALSWAIRVASERTAKAARLAKKRKAT
ncbi:hypothetical protein P7C70_g2865, partial [Phenoliferia sp. Uapishka_3]